MDQSDVSSGKAFIANRGWCAECGVSIGKDEKRSTLATIRRFGVE